MADATASQSRRALLSAAAGAAGALAASAVIPAIVVADDPNDVQRGTDNATTATTSITDSGIDSTAFAAHATGTGTGSGIEATSLGAAGVFAWSVGPVDWEPPFEPGVLTHTGVFGFSPAGDGVTTAGSGVWGDSPDTGVYGTGSTGVAGVGSFGVYGYTEASNGAGVYAESGSNSGYALWAEGKAHFRRSGSKAIKSGRSSVSVSLSGVRSSSLVFAVLATSESGRWVRAVVPASGRFTVHLNASLRSKAEVAWLVLD